jgi:hypothetical protein
MNLCVAMLTAERNFVLLILENKIINHMRGYLNLGNGTCLTIICLNCHTSLNCLKLVLDLSYTHLSNTCLTCLGDLTVISHRLVLIVLHLLVLYFSYLSYTFFTCLTCLTCLGDLTLTCLTLVVLVLEILHLLVLHLSYLFYTCLTLVLLVLEICLGDLTLICHRLVLHLLVLHLSYLSWRFVLEILDLFVIDLS